MKKKINSTTKRVKVMKAKKAKKAKNKVTKKTKVVKAAKIAKKSKKTVKTKKPKTDIVQVKHPDGGYAKIDRISGVLLKTKKTKFAGLVVARKVDSAWFK